MASALSPTVQAEACSTADSGAAPGSTHPRAVGRYEILREHARGGLGCVLRARDADLRREVALKVLLRGSNVAAERFLREARITAQLEHPSIVPVHELGTRDDGTPYYTMKMISGRSLKEAIGAAATLAERLTLVSHLQAVADAMAYAHARKIIHRDLKPSNIICGDFGETVVIDWGLAKTLDDPTDRDGPVDPSMSPYRVVASGALTATGAIMGTPAYMSPEQARGEHVDQRCDVYALGAMLYHIIGGAAPYARTRGSSVVAEVIAGPPRPIGETVTGVPPDLAAIADKAMARDPAARYPTAAELAVDLRRYLTGGLVGARAYSVRDLVRRWLRRHRGIAASAAAALTAVAVIAAVSVHRVVVERDVAERARDAAAQRADELTLAHARSALHTDATESIAWLKTYSAAGRDLSAMYQIAGDALSLGVARHAWDAHAGAVFGLRFSPDGTQVATYGTDHQLWLWDVEAGTGRRVLSGRASDLASLSFAPDGSHVALGLNDGAIALVSTDGSTVRDLRGGEGLVTVVAHSSDGRWLLSTGADGAVRRWDLATGAGRVVTSLDATAYMLRMSPDDAYAATCDEQQHLDLIELETGKRRRLGVCERSEVMEVPLAFSPDGTLIAAGDGQGDVRLWPAAGGPPRILPGADGIIHDLAITSDGRTLAAASSSGSAFVWDVETGQKRHEIPDCSLRVAFAPGGSLLACAGRSGAIVVRDVERGGEWSLSGERAASDGLEFSPNGETLAAAWINGRVRLWSPPPARPRAYGSIASPVAAPAYGADGRWLITADTSGALTLVDVTRGKQRVLFTNDTGLSALGLLGPDAGSIAVGDLRGRVLVIERESAESRVLGTCGGQISDLRVMPDGASFATTSLDGEVRLWRPQRAEHTVLGRHDAPARRLAVAADGASVASGASDGSIRVWSLVDGTARELVGHEDVISDLAFSPAGDRLLSTSWDGTARLWDLTTGTSGIVTRHESPVRSAAWMPDGVRVLTGGADGAVMLADVAGDGAPVRLLGHEQNVMAIRVTADGRIAVTAASDGTVRVWWLPDGQSAVLRGPGVGLPTLALSPDGSRIAVTGDDVVTEWAMPERPPGWGDRAALDAVLRAATTSEIADGRSRHRTPR